MSIHDPSRTYADPVEVVARAIYEDRNGAGCTPWARQNGLMTKAYRADATAALEALTKHGFLSDQYFDARNAMKARDGK